MLLVGVHVVPSVLGCVDKMCRQKLHAALGTAARLVADDGRVHGTRVNGTFGDVELHLGDEGKRLVRSRVQKAGGSLALGHEIVVCPQPGELLRQRWLGWLVSHSDRGQLIRVGGCSVLEGVLAGAFKQNVDHVPLGRR